MSKKPMTVRLPAELAERLREIAFRCRVSQASIVEQAVRAEVEQLEMEEGR